MLFRSTKEQIEQYIREHIIRGDRGDGIPNFLSPDNTFVVGERQKTINKNRLNEWLQQSPENFCTTDTMKHGYTRNQTLIDLDFTPSNIKSKIIESYKTIKPKTKADMLNYLMKHRLKNLLEVCDEF